MRLILIKVHLYLGLVGGALLCIVALTGALYAYEPQLRGLLSEKIAPWSLETMLSPQELNERIYELGFEGAATDYRWPDEADAPVWVIWRDAEGQRQDFMLDPTTGERLPKAEVARVFFHGALDVHRRLTMGEFGQKVVGFAALSLLVLTVSGLCIGVRRWRDAKRVWIPSSAESKSCNPRIFWRFLHRILGAWATPWLLLMPLTGMVWSFEAYSGFLKGIGGPERFPSAPTVESYGSKERASLDAIWQRCLEEVAEQTTMRLMLPTTEESPVRFEWSPPGVASFAMRSRLFLDPQTGYVIERQPWEEFSAGEQLVRWAYPLHTGRIAGLAGQTAAFLGALSIPFFFGTGLYLYIARKRRSSGRPLPNKTTDENSNEHTTRSHALVGRSARR